MTIPSAASAGRSSWSHAASCRRTSSRIRTRSSASTSPGARPSIDRTVSARVELVLETGDANHEELVQVAGDDREEAHALEQRQ